MAEPTRPAGAGCGHGRVASAIISDIQRYSIHDGAGIRTVVFFKGCPLRCVWCANPETQRAEPELMVRKNRCTGCGRCVEVCPTRAIVVSGREVRVKRDLCDDCGKCAEECKEGALVIIGRRVGCEELVSRVERDRAFYEASKGGVTVSGGEPLMQAEFLQGFLESCQAQRMDICLETCGYAPWEALKRILPLTGLVYYDVKHMDPGVHRAVTDQPNGLILENLREAVRLARRIVVRSPIVPGQNDRDEHLVRLAEFVRDLGGVETVELLPYHKLGMAKYEGLGRHYAERETEVPSVDHMRRLRDIVASHGVKCELG